MTDNQDWREAHDSRAERRRARLEGRNARRAHAESSDDTLNGQSVDSGTAQGQGNGADVLHGTAAPASQALAFSHTRYTQAPTTPDGDLLNISEWRIPRYDYSRDDVSPMPAVNFEVYENDASLEYSWPATGESEIYRVTTSEDVMPDDPDSYDSVALTRGTSFKDLAPQTRPVRYVRVWGYTYDPNRADKTLGQCRLVAEGIYVFPLADWTLTYSEGTVLSNWKVARPALGSGLRVTVDYCRADGGESLRALIRDGEWMNRIVPDDGTGFLNGFADASVIEGQSYSYIAAVRVGFPDGKVIPSRPAHQSIRINAEFPPKVSDLVVHSEVTEKGNFCRLMWTQPSTGEVRIYRLKEEPDAKSVQEKALTVEQLDKVLDPHSVVKNPSAPIRGEDANGRYEISQVKWPDDEEWDRITFVPVTFLDGKASIGTPVTQRRAGELASIKVVQRGDWYLVTFAWPGEAVQVEMNWADTKEAFEYSANNSFSVDHETYRRCGGFIVPASTFPAHGCVLQLRSLTYYDGLPYFSEPSYVDVGAQWVYDYEVRTLKTMGGLMNTPITEVLIKPREGYVPPNAALSFVITYNDTRYPLHREDGRFVSFYTTSPDTPGAMVQTSVQVPSQGVTPLYIHREQNGIRGGFIRIFPFADAQARTGQEMAHAALERFLVNDPSLTSLRMK